MERQLFEQEVNECQMDGGEGNGPVTEQRVEEHEKPELHRSGQITTDFASGSSTGIAKRMKIMNKNPF